MALTGRSDTASLEARLRAIERELRSLKSAQNPSASKVVPARGNVPTVEGLSISKTVAGLQVSWTAVSIRDFRHYELDVDTTSNFSSPTTFKVQETSFLYNPGTGVGSTTYYFRVRVVTIGRGKGGYARISSLPGLVRTPDISFYAVEERNVKDEAVSTLNYVSDSTDIDIDNSSAFAYEGFYLLQFTVLDASDFTTPYRGAFRVQDGTDITFSVSGSDEVEIWYRLLIDRVNPLATPIQSRDDFEVLERLQSALLQIFAEDNNGQGHFFPPVFLTNETLLPGETYVLSLEFERKRTGTADVEFTSTQREFELFLFKK